MFLFPQHFSLVNIANKDGNTPLHHACNVDSLDTAKVLIDAGAEISLMNKNNEIPADLTNVGLMLKLSVLWSKQLCHWLD